MTTWGKNTGSAGELSLSLGETGTNASANTSTVHCIAKIYTPAGSFHSDSDLSVSLSGSISWSTGSWSFDSSGGWHTLYDEEVTIHHNSDGTGSVSVTFHLNDDTNTSGVGGPASVSGSITLTHLTVAPGQPTALTATRVSDTQINLAWTRHYASNGVPTDTNCRKTINGAAWVNISASGNIASMAVAAIPNQKTAYDVQQSNSAGASAWSATSGSVWTTPAAPDSCTAAKGTDGSITVTWNNNVGYSEYGTEVWHGTVAGGVTTWDASPLTTAASGATSYTHTGPSNTVVHVYQVRAKTTSGTTLYSGYSTSNSVQLLAPPNAPTMANLPTYADKAQSLQIKWTHNAVDSTAQTAYEIARSTDGGTTWITTGKNASTGNTWSIAASTYAGNAAVTVRVRTWGAMSTGGSDGTGASPWSTTDTVTFKTAPVVTITAPTAATGVAQSQLLVNLGFTQAEGATMVSADVTLAQGSTVLETVTTTTKSNIPFNTRLADGQNYTLTATATSSVQLTDDAPAVTFNVNYSSPSSATLVATYVPQAGMTQLVLSFPAAVAPQVNPTSFTVTRTINNETETIVSRQTVDGDITILDTTPTINGDNTYAVTTFTSDGASSDPVIGDAVTGETRWAYINTGDSYANYVMFYGDLNISSTPDREGALMSAAGRSRPIALFGASSTLDISVSATILTDEGSSPQDIETLLLTAKRACFRAPSGRRVFGKLSNAQISNIGPQFASLSFTLSEAS